MASESESQLKAAGPLGSFFRVMEKELTGVFGADANALVVLNRVAFLNVSRGVKMEEGGKRALLDWACATGLGQERGASADLVAAVSARRAAALRALSGSAGERHVLRLRAEPEWRMAVGLGTKANAHEIGLALHGTYGWPVIPGPALKGLVRSWAVSSGVPDAEIARVLGGAAPAAQGTVRFLDAMPDSKPVSVVADVMTPHVKPYYDHLAGSAPRAAPAEYHNPVPLPFLTVRGGYAVDLWGPDPDDLSLAAHWLAAAGDELGAGAKTAAGYGYLAVTRVPEAS